MSHFRNTAQFQMNPVKQYDLHHVVALSDHEPCVLNQSLSSFTFYSFSWIQNVFSANAKIDI